MTDDTPVSKKAYNLIKAQVKALKRTNKQLIGKVNLAEKKARVIGKFDGADGIINDVVNALGEIKISNLTVKDLEMVNISKDRLTDLYRRIS